MATILLAVTGSIAAYKAADLASKLHQAGHSVHVVMSEAARELVGPSTFLNLTGNPVFTSLWDAESQTRHIQLTDAADLAVLAPATANSLAKLAHGLADEVVSTTLLALRCPLLICPAMNVRMWENPVVQRNLTILRELGHEVLTPGSGHLACGHVGAGRLAEPLEIQAAVESLLAQAPPPSPPSTEPSGEYPALGKGILERLLGPWQLAGVISGQPVQQTVVGEQVLGGAFVRLHCRPEPAAGEGFSYEALVTLGRVEGDDTRCSLHLVEAFGGKAGSSHGTGELIKRDTVRFALEQGGKEYTATLSWVPAEEGWDLSVGRAEDQPFAVLQLRRE
jgi:3-polyprenyl-4-hydroxybenzoate decarboxylase